MATTATGSYRPFREASDISPSPARFGGSFPKRKALYYANLSEHVIVMADISRIW